MYIIPVGDNHHEQNDLRQGNLPPVLPHHPDKIAVLTESPRGPRGGTGQSGSGRGGACSGSHIRSFTAPVGVLARCGWRVPWPARMGCGQAIAFSGQSPWQFAVDTAGPHSVARRCTLSTSTKSAFLSGSTRFCRRRRTRCSTKAKAGRLSRPLASKDGVRSSKRFLQPQSQAIRDRHSQSRDEAACPISPVSSIMRARLRSIPQ